MRAANSTQQNPDQTALSDHALRAEPCHCVGNRFAGIVDAQATLAQGNHIVLYVWYDNEFGYSRQVVRCLEELAGVVMPNFPKRARAV